MAEARPKKPFLYTPAITSDGDLAMLHLKRDAQTPILLSANGDSDGYAEGVVTNTRFGSFPHSTLLGLGWGAQVRASKVDTGTRGRKGKGQKGSNGQQKGEEKAGDPVDDGNAKKRSSDTAELPAEGRETKRSKSETDTFDEVKKDHAPSNEDARKTKKSTGYQAPGGGQGDLKVAIEAGTGFAHLLQPTPEAWTASLDHRTQVVYTPDYSYILQRLRVRPGSTIIEAGAGSGSFTHAAVRAVYNRASSHRPHSQPGKVYSFEYHEPRVATLRNELREHGIDDIVTLTHRDVCNDGFSSAALSPEADAVFLDLPAPWQALKHLNRSNTSLNPDNAIHLCTFSPCIEQVQATVSFLRKAGWTEIDMVEIQNKRLDVRREQVGINNEGLRGVIVSAATVEESLGRLREVENKMVEYHATHPNGPSNNSNVQGAEEGTGGVQTAGKGQTRSKAERLERIKRDAAGRKLYKEGNLVHRVEPEVKTHTSYLVFAVLPRGWSEEDERRCLEALPIVKHSK